MKSPSPCTLRTKNKMHETLNVNHKRDYDEAR